MKWAIKTLIEWFFTAFLLPLFSILSLYFHSKKAEMVSKKAVEELNKAKTKDEIDSAIDNLP